jgi:hypothetical protein
MTAPEKLEAATMRDALAALQRAHARPIGEGDVARRPGLYAIHGDAGVWLTLGLGEPPDDRPLYVGKAEDSLFSRAVEGHFSDGSTGRSTVRRTLAALLRESVGFEGRHRNPDKPDSKYAALYGLSSEHEKVLTAWMRTHLALATWAKPAGGHLALHQIETPLLERLIPPLNDDVSPLRAQLRAARKVMADQVRESIADE